MNAVAAPPEESRQNIRVVFIGLMLVLLMASLDQTIVATALPTIVGDLGGLNHISWVVTAYLLAQTAVTPLYGKLGDQYGRKVVLQVALVIFLGGSALCGAAQNLDMLIAFRAIQGLGGGGLLVTTIAAIGDVVPPRERGRYQGYFGAAFGFSSVIGPLLGGVLTTNLSWRWIFYVNLPIGVLAFSVLAATFPGRSERVHHRIDYAGAALLAASLSAVVLLSTLGGTTYKWGSPEIIGMGAAAIVLLAAFVRVERRAAEPVLPLRLFRNPIFDVTSAIGLIVGFALFGSVTYLPLFLQVVHGASPTSSGLQILPLVGGLLVTSISSGRIISNTGIYKPFPIAGTATMVVGLSLLSTTHANTSRGLVSVYMFILGLGLGMVMQVLVLVVQNAVDYKDLGVATSGATLFRSIGGSVGVAILGSIFSTRLTHNLAATVPARAVGNLPGGVAHASPTALKRLPPAIHTAYVGAFANSLDTVFAVAAGVAGVAFLLSWTLQQRPLRDSVAGGSSGIGESFAVPKHTDSLAEASRALTRLVGREGRRRLGERIAEQAGVDVSPSAGWLLVRIHDDPATDVPAVADAYDVPLDVANRALGELEDKAMIERGGPPRALTVVGREASEKLIAARRERFARLLDGWDEDGEQRLAQLLTRLADELGAEPPRELAAQR